MKALRNILWTVLGIAAVLLVWGLFEPYVVDTERYEVSIEGLPRAWEGQEIAQISDWQVGMWLDNEPTVERIVDRLRVRRPAVVLITGDFVYHSARAPDDLIAVRRLVTPLVDAGLPVYAVLGNHDYGMKRPDGRVDVKLARAVRRTLAAAGARILENAALPLTAPDRRGAVDPNASAPDLYLVGIGPHWPNRDDVSEALADVPDGAPRLVMMHNPTTFGALPARTAPLAVAGHTHGGQVRIPFTPEWAWLTYVQSDAVHADGWIDGYGAPGNRLYVNRGIGMSIVPLRINCAPELTLFTLSAAP